MPTDPTLLAFSLTAGAVAFVNPCGIAVLPAYVSYFIGSAQHVGGSWTSALARGALLGLISTIGFMLVFGTAGIAISALGSWLLRYVPWMAAAVGFAIVGLGVLLLLGRSPSIGVRVDLAAHISSRGPRSFLLFGIAYAVASLSCTSPIFIYVTLQAASLGSLEGAVATVASYVIGMGAMMTLFSTLLVTGSQKLLQYTYNAMPVIKRVAGLIVIAAGLYIVYFQLVLGGMI